MDKNVGSSLPEDILDRLFAESKTTSLADALEVLAKISRNADGRADLASRSVLALILDLIQGHLKYLNSEILNTFIEKSGVGITLTILRAPMRALALDCRAVRIALHALANFFPKEFLMPARIWRQDIVDPLCIILYTCQDGNPVCVAEPCEDPGLSLVSEIARTASIEEWFNLLLSVICLEEAHLPTLFIELAVAFTDDSKDVQLGCDEFSPDQAFLISACGRINAVTISNEFTLYILGVFRKASRPADFSGGGQVKSSYRVLSYQCALLSGLLNSLLHLLLELEPPPIIRKALNQGQHQGKTLLQSSATVYTEGGACKISSDARMGLLCLCSSALQMKIARFLREGCIWTIRNLFEGNIGNQQAIAELELWGTVNTPDIAKLGLRVELD
ncbi:hypothetical protein ACJRO7_034429 [Eucalyptus globulus]|uniref:Ataxin-10 domain-containing protein n=1 Tax=Eucalyptus globulus TaxID=34317 RepID=A0ABD3J375_EUCGL